ncbi:uncharacterized protein MYCFIDRAFT_174503 [Pseudocercospora fijiensis CIRAD86]|uniref:Uncharacterized protein n=1 Tax=Pseudocercospora fijiensis (strain CIRAD86) TaxID=383855 RepID=M3B0N8_PSEFD|nr:uncharacterized protein MYCFIDRAFT_174503 [Pseudocercospora fijiensis CIRAD86]EME83007.1 hypothetical protein MYCFIDRAFT_174503 [Pseudocercospora fijiensis CIRAD86]
MLCTDQKLYPTSAASDFGQAPGFLLWSSSHMRLKVWPGMQVDNTLMLTRTLPFEWYGRPKALYIQRCMYNQCPIVSITTCRSTLPKLYDITHCIVGANGIPEAAPLILDIFLIRLYFDILRLLHGLDLGVPILFALWVSIHIIAIFWASNSRSMGGIGSVFKNHSILPKACELPFSHIALDIRRHLDTHVFVGLWVLTR